MSDAATILYICDTCKYADGERVKNGVSAGEVFHQAVAAAAEGEAAVRVVRFSCLMGCEHPCNAALQGPDKVCYVLGGFAPEAEAAAALVDYAAKHALSETGVVPYRTWPQGVKGKFIARIPPRPEL